MTDDSAQQVSPSASQRPLPWSVELGQKINRRRFLRRAADGIFASVMVGAVGELSFRRPARPHINCTDDCDTCGDRTGDCCECETANTCCPYGCCGPSPCCGTSCCTQNCCQALGSSLCAHCSYHTNSWCGFSCWQKNFPVGNCTYVITCCDCNSQCRSDICICSSKAKFCTGDTEWSRWDPTAGRWIPASQDLYPEVAIPIKHGRRSLTAGPAH